MKKILLTTLIALLVFGFTSTAKAVVLPMGGTVNIAGGASPGGALVAGPLISPYTAIGSTPATGTVTSWVRQSATGLVFEYMFSVDALYQGIASQFAARQAAITDFDNFQTWVDAIPEVALTDSQAFTVSRDPFGHAVSFAYPPHFVLPGYTSTLMWVQTNTQYWTIGNMFLQDGAQANVPVYCPTVPEPTTMLLLGMGILGLFGFRRKVLA